MHWTHWQYLEAPDDLITEIETRLDAERRAERDASKQANRSKL